MTTSTISPLTPGPCGPWINRAQVNDYRSDTLPDNISQDLLDFALDAATDLLYVLSARQFPGKCSTKIRPLARPITFTLADWAAYYQQLSGAAWSSSWGRCSGDTHQWCRNPPQIDLGVYPIVSIDQVLIDGVEIPDDEYRVDDFRFLVRTLPTINAMPTERYGWPTHQDYRLPDTEPGTFSVTVTFGMSPPAIGVMACATLAAELALAMSGQDNRLPSRVTSITRQEVSMAILDPMNFLAQGKTGIYEVDLFLEAYNPGGKARSAPQVFSPDLDYSRRQTS